MTKATIRILTTTSLLLSSACGMHFDPLHQGGAPDNQPRPSTATGSTDAAPGSSKTAKHKAPSNSSASGNGHRAPKTKPTTGSDKTPTGESDYQDVNADRTALTATQLLNGQDQRALTQDLRLPTTGSHGTKISWSSSSAALSATGKVSRPSAARGDAAVTLVATVSKGQESAFAYFYFQVAALADTSAALLAADKAALTSAVVLGGQDAQAVTTSLLLPSSGAINGSSITWASSQYFVVSPTGQITQPEMPSGDAAVTLTATLTNGVSTDTVSIPLTVAKAATPASETDSDAVHAAKAALTDASILGTQSYWEVRTDLSLPTLGIDGTHITWASDNTAIDATGKVTRPARDSNFTSVTLTATITKGVSAAIVTFQVAVSPIEM